jgi:hypothetical protein
MSNKQFKLILNNLDDRIDKLVSKHGMTPRIEKINEEWVDLMYAFSTDYRGVSDDDELVRLATEIYREINYTQQYEERPLDARLSELKVGISTTGANAIRYGDSIVIKDSDDELTKINKRYNEIHGIAGVRVNFSNKGGPKGLMYDQRHGHNLFQLKMTDKDLSNNALGIETTKKRSHEHNNNTQVAKKKKKTTFPYYYLKNRILFVVGDDKMAIMIMLNDKKIPFIVEINGTISVESDKYSLVYDMLGTPMSAITEPIVSPLSTVSKSFKDLPVHEPFITFNGGHVLDWYHFQGDPIFQIPWKESINASPPTNNHVFIADSGTASFYYMAVKREAEWSRHIKEIHTNIGTNISITPEFGEFIDNKDFLKYDVVLTFLSQRISEKSKHSNAIIIDNVKKLFIRFEPHGQHESIYECYDMKQCDINFKEALKNYGPLSTYTYIGPPSNKEGPQTIELSQTLYDKVVSRIGSTIRTLEAGGFCLAWTTLFCHYYNANSIHGYGYDDVYKHLNLSANALATLIRRFQGYLVNMTKVKHGDDTYDYIKKLFDLP